MKVLYKCDPEKNKKCRKSMCYTNPNGLKNPCRATRNPDYAVLDENGRPIIYWIRFEVNDPQHDGGDC